MHRILILLLALLATTFAAEQPTSLPGGAVVGRDNPAGTANTAGLLKFWSGGNNAFFTIFQAGTQTGSVTYTLPTAQAAVGGQVLTDAAANGVLSWATPSGGITGALTATRVPYATGAAAVTDSANLTVDTTTGTGTLAVGMTTDATTPTAAALTVAGGIGAGRIRTTNPSVFDGVVVGANSQPTGGITEVGYNIGGHCNHTTIVGSGASATYGGGTGSLYSTIIGESTTGNGQRATLLGYATGSAGFANVTAIGADAVGNAANQIVLGNANVTDLKSAATFHPTAGAAASASAMSFGVALTEGLQLKVIEETVSFAVAAKYKTLTQTIPVGALILSSAVNIQSTITAGGTSVKVGLGLNGTTPSSYGLAADLVKNSKITNGFLGGTVTPLAAPLTLDVCICETTGAALGNTNATAGTVRVRIVYTESADLANAP